MNLDEVIWPVFDEKDEQALLEVLKSGQWFHGGGRFELAARA